MNVLEVQEKDGAVQFRVKVQARARRDEITGVHDGALKIKLTAPALEGRANAALCALLAKRLKVPQASIKIAAGERAPRKLIEVIGVTPDQVRKLAQSDD